MDKEKNLYDRAFARAQKETEQVIETVRKQKEYLKGETLPLLREVGGKITKLDNQRKQINTLLKTTKDKKQRLDLLEQHHEVVNTITEFWNRKNSKLSKDMKDLEPDA